MAARKRLSSVQQDAASLYEVATAFIRLYQFRDRNQGLRFGLTVVQAYALDILLSSKGVSLNELARELQLDKSTASRVISGMARHGLVEWSRPEHDLRAKKIVASAEGSRRYRRLRQAIIRDNARLLAKYTPTARRVVITALRELTHRANSVSAGRSTRSRAPWRVTK